VKATARLAAAGVGLAAAIWLAPASVHLVSWSSSGGTRIAFVPPLARLMAALAIAALAIGGSIAVARQRGAPLDAASRVLAPLGLFLFWMIPYAPWLPDRAPVLLIFAGPLRWVIALIAGAIVSGRLIPGAWTPRLPVPPRAVIFVISAAVYATLGIQYAREMGFGGDEPHYLIITHSLLVDRDLDIANNHERRDYRAFFPGELRPDFLRRGTHGEIYSIHAPGLPAVLLPAYAIAGALGAVVLMAIFAGLTALAIHDAAAIVVGEVQPRAAVLAWAATCFTVPFVPHAWLIYPELPGALIVAVAVVRLWRPPGSVAGAFAFGALMAALPWLHTKFALLLAFFALFEAIRLWPRWKHIAAFAAPSAISGVAWLYSFYRMYGELNPEAPYGNYTRMFVLWQNIPRGTFGLLFDQKFGLLMYSPVYLVAIAGAWLMLRDSRSRLRAAALIATALAFFISTTRLYMWWGGGSAPARFLVPVVPLLAPFVASGIARIRGVGGRAAVLGTLVASFAIAAITIGSPDQELLYSAPHGVSALVTYLQGRAPLDVSIPTFTEEDWRRPLLLLAPWLLSAAAVAAAVTIGVSRRALQSPAMTATLGALAFLVVGSIGVGFRDVPDRDAIVARGQLALMDAYDPSRLHAVSPTKRKRLTSDDVLAAAAITIRRPGDQAVGDARGVAGPIDLPQGRYEARVWFESRQPPDGEAFVALSDQVLLARVQGPLTNPVVMPFDLKIHTPAFVGVTDGPAARAARRVEISPVALPPRSARANLSGHVVEPVDGFPGAYLAYVDDRTYPEHGVFWTRGTRQGSVAIVTNGATTLRLILHVGPTGGPVSIEADGRPITVELSPNETREVTVPMHPAADKILLSVRASRAFRPSAVDPNSDDNRSLGCQVRPVVR
jgi:hypothetical protein